MQEEARVGGHSWPGFIAVMITLVAITFAMLAADPATAGRYTVAECGWYVGHDAGWSDTSDSKFNRSSFCQPARSSGAFDSVHMTSKTKSGSDTIGGTKFAGWRWTAPAGVTMTTVHGHRWQVLNDSFEHRLGTVSGSGFTPFLKLSATDTSPKDFRQNNLPAGTTAFESRLLCARASDKRCKTEKVSSAMVRALTFTLEDPSVPSATTSGTAISQKWLRGNQTLGWTGKDRGSGLRASETSIDGAVRSRTNHQCNTVSVGGLTQGSRMQPCPLSVQGQHTINTAQLSDGSHTLRHCAIDFAGNSGCVPGTTLRTDNTPPGTPRALTVVGGDGWRRTNEFELNWTVPDQGTGSPVTGSKLRITNPDGVVGATRPGTAPNQISGLTVPAPGEYPVRVWLADEAGNELESNAAETTLRFDDVPPTGHFAEPDPQRPELIRVPVFDRFSGVAGGTISIRSQEGGQPRVLPTVLAGSTDERQLEARLPSEELGPGRWVLTAAVNDLAGNEAMITRRGNGSVPVLETPLKFGSSLTARLSGGGTSGSTVWVGLNGSATLTGRLLLAGKALGDRVVNVTESPRPGSLRRATARRIRTDATGRFHLNLGRGVSRRVNVTYLGDERFTGASVGPLDLRVRARLGFRATPRSLSTGKLVKFRGRVKAPLAHNHGRRCLVAIQYLERRSGRWRPVLVTRTGQRGYYRAGYRFRYIKGVAVIRMRAVLLPSPGFPYARTVSRTAVVKVRG